MLLQITALETGAIPFPIAGSISTIETCAPSGAKNSTTSRPTAPLVVTNI